jgi:xanthine dehydrogenase small subunit
MKKKDRALLAEIRFLLNGKEISSAVPPGLTALELLNDRLSLHGTKSSCNEGDCGACTVLIGQRQENKVSYQAVNSCLYPAFRLHGKHLITVEGISADKSLHPVQTALLDEHGTQCGFCTPGFVMSMLGLFLNNSNPTDAEILAALEGNLCRCTGYDSIFKAALLLKKRLDKKQELLPARLRKAEKLLGKSELVQFIESENREGFATLQCFLPASLNELWKVVDALRKEGNYKFLAGGTDLMVLANIQHLRYRSLVELGGISELDGIALLKDNLSIGANVTLTQLQFNKHVQKHYPLLVQAIEQMASTQIRNSATLAGNIANASPVADGATTLLALGASVVLASQNKERTVRLCDFYHAYKQTELKPDEIIKAILLPLPDRTEQFCSFIKSAKRKAVDISGVVSALVLQYKNDKIISAALSFGGVAAYPALAGKTSDFLKGKKLSPELVEQAAEVAQKEFIPISDIRGSQEYRSLLIRNHVIKHLKNFQETVHSAGRRS